jgi:hypothetical protein
VEQGTQAANSETSAVPSKKWERTVVLFLCIVAMVHVVAFSLAFPPTNNVDEYFHFDLAIRYSHGEIPTQVYPISNEAMNYIARYGTWEYTCVPVAFAGQKYPPPFWTLPADKAAAMIAANSAALQRPNYEDSQPPLYYVVAGFWWRMGHWLGLEMSNLYYWLRLLDLIIVVAVIVVGYVTACFIFPENLFLRLAVPALIALMPQSEFYSIDNDVLSPLCFGLTFLFLLKWWQTPSVALGIGLGLAFAATYLTKITNLPLLAVVGAALVLKALQSSRAGKWTTVSPSLAAFLYCAVPPIVLWILWCKSQYGYTFGNLNVLYAGWKLKPFAQWWHHPIYTPSGLWTYLSGQLGTYWQGEFWWHGQERRMSLPGTDSIYTALSLFLLAMATPALSARFSNIAPGQRLAMQTGLACVLAGLAFFALSSVVYDFQNCVDPSRQHPFFHAGRMILGTLIPFLLLFVYGLDRLLNRFGTAAKFITLAGTMSAMLALEIVTDWPAFFSQYNWFHSP